MSEQELENPQRSWIQYDFSKAPSALYTSLSDYRCGWGPGPLRPTTTQACDDGHPTGSAITTQTIEADVPNNFLKGVRWSPDGACILTSCEDNVLRVYDLPTDCLESEEQPLDTYTAALCVREGEAVSVLLTEKEAPTRRSAPSYAL
ncbi:hypothetical protein CYMTET_36330 [Cymbomonas tetramitiformis]|uniref:Uncharacterized protein n=1 Tax=Cymbomonas tetramitiformis TaxID=36881 RepID=A0AAE0F7V2_9CHLO|nr:hypothetical protein CYMTET_36330 [Cymbomonas tetramitiformis]